MDHRTASEYSPYSRLPGNGSVRFLHAQRDGDGGIQCKLVPFCLYSPACPSFNTLSYVWGQEDVTDESPSITINGQPWRVLPTVYPILEAICDNISFGTAFWFWIDSICINQADDQERATQVQLMRDLYKKSSLTIVWLGGRSDTSDTAIDFLYTLHKHRKLINDSVRESGRGIPAGVAELHREASWKALEQLLSRPWFLRVWTLQEFVLSSNVDFYCGPLKSIRRKLLHQMIYAIWNCFPRRYIPDTAWLSAWRRRRLFQWSEGMVDVGLDERMPLPALMAFTGDYKWTDPRDRIYSMLGLTSEVDRRIVGEPTYMVPVQKVYRDYVKSFIDTRQNLDIICFAHSFMPIDDSLPSWVPDWRRPVLPNTIPLMVSQSAFRHVGNFRPVQRMSPHTAIPEVAYEASGKETAKVQFSSDGLKLICGGVFLDYVDGIGITIPLDYLDGSTLQEPAATLKHSSETTEFVQSTSQVHLRAAHATGSEETSAENPPNDDRIEDLIRTIVLDRGDNYIHSPVPTDFRTEFLRAASQFEQDDKKLGQFGKWLTGNKRLLIMGSTLGDIVTAATRSCKVDLTKPVEDGWECFLARHKGVVKHMQRRLSTTECGRIGMMPDRACKGDTIAILFGCSVPVILRRIGGEKDEYQFIGEAYVHGCMNGEVFGSRETFAKEFVLV
jgi:hypothetical protein